MNTFTFSDIRTGMAASFPVKITQEMQNMFLHISGDVNPLHKDIRWSKSCGYPQPLVYGMLTASFYSTLIGVYLPGKYALFQECSIAFVQPVYVNDELTVQGTVTEINETFKRITVKAEILRNGKKVSRAKLYAGFVENNAEVHHE